MTLNMYATSEIRFLSVVAVISVMVQCIYAGYIPGAPAFHAVPAVHSVPAVPYNVPPYVHSHRYHATIPRVPAVYAAPPAPLIARGVYPVGVPSPYLPIGHHRYAAPVAPVPVPVPGGPVLPGGHLVPGAPVPFVY